MGVRISSVAPIMQYVRRRVGLHTLYLLGSAPSAATIYNMRGVVVAARWVHIPFVRCKPSGWFDSSPRHQYVGKTEQVSWLGKLVTKNAEVHQSVSRVVYGLKPYPCTIWGASSMARTIALQAIDQVSITWLSTKYRTEV